MDLASVIGITSGIGVIFLAISTKTDLAIFLDLASFLIVVGGTLAATLASSSMQDFKNTVEVLKQYFFQQEVDMLKLVKEFMNYSKIIRKDGPQKLEKVQVDERFLKKGLQMIADGIHEDEITKTLSIEKDAIYTRHKVGQEMMETMGDFFPAFGMIGTMIGLVIMLLNLDDPSLIGPSMSVALITTFYGAVFANVFALPAAKKLQQKSGLELIRNELIIQGVQALRRGENPQIMEDKLLGFLRPEKPASLDKDKKQKAGPQEKRKKEKAPLSPNEPTTE